MLPEKYSLQNAYNIITVFINIMFFTQKIWMQWLPCRPRTSWANLWFLSALRPLQVNHRLTLTHHHTSNQPRSQHCKLQVIHCRFCSGRLWHHYTLFPPFVPGKASDDDDNTKTEAAKMQKEYESLKDSTKDIQTAAEISEYIQGSYIIFTSMFNVFRSY